MKKHLIPAINAALAAGEKIIEVYESDNFDVDFKADDSPLTKADRLAHHEIISYLKECDLPVLSEEGKDIAFEERQKWGDFWLVDPLDGTKEFIKKNGEFTVNIAYIRNGQALAGVIYVPVLQDLYVGVVGEGAWKLEQIAPDSRVADWETVVAKGVVLPKQKNNMQFTVVGSRSHMSAETEAFIEKLKARYGNSAILSKGSSLKICMVAEGLADVYPRFAPTMEWDTGAGTAIAAAAGCLVTHQDGKTPLNYNKENLLNPWFVVYRPDIQID